MSRDKQVVKDREAPLEKYGKFVDHFQKFICSLGKLACFGRLLQRFHWERPLTTID